MITALIPTAHRPDAARRLMMGLALSIAAHAALMLAVRPRAVDFVQARPLQVEIVQPAIATDPAMVVASDSDIAIPTGAARQAADHTDERKLANTATARVSGPELGFAPDRYYNSREVDVRAEPVNEVPLIYPQFAYQNRVRGVVLLKILINERGTIDDVSIVEADPKGTFEGAARNAIVATRFSPAVRNGRPVKSQKMLEVKFDPYESIHIP